MVAKDEELHLQAQCQPSDQDKTRNEALLSHKVTCQVLNTTLEEWDDLSSTAQNAKYQEATGVYDILYFANLNDTGKVYYTVFECTQVPYAYADKYLKKRESRVRLFIDRDDEDEANAKKAKISDYDLSE